MASLLDLVGGKSYQQQKALHDANTPLAQYGQATATEQQHSGQLYNQFQGLLTGGQDALNQSARAAVEAAMPSFHAAIQGSRENAIARGIGTGDLGTSYEGDIASAFDRNLTNSISGQALGLYGQQLGAAGGAYDNSQSRYDDLMGGRLEYDAAKQNSKTQAKGAMFGALGSLAGAAASAPWWLL